MSVWALSFFSAEVVHPILNTHHTPAMEIHIPKLAEGGTNSRVSLFLRFTNIRGKFLCLSEYEFSPLSVAKKCHGFFFPILEPHLSPTPSWGPWSKGRHGPEDPRPVLYSFWGALASLGLTWQVPDGGSSPCFDITACLGPKTHRQEGG